ncbi:IS3 family transposase [Streptomyces sp. NPDC085929]|uniref:IS3 family transposase n=1 Tax=Streptomyces sp. NPDC085929 TaxID=3365739 RepID=UPI0037CEBF0B
MPGTPGVPAGYYRWIAGADARAARQAAEDALVDEIREIHAEHRGNYDALRVHAELRGFGHTVNRKRVARLMRKHDIVGRHLRTKKRTTVTDSENVTGGSAGAPDSLTDSVGPDDVTEALGALVTQGSCGSLSGQSAIRPHWHSAGQRTGVAVQGGVECRRQLTGPALIRDAL